MGGRGHCNCPGLNNLHTKIKWNTDKNIINGKLCCCCFPQCKNICVCFVQNGTYFYQYFIIGINASFPEFIDAQALDVQWIKCRVNVEKKIVTMTLFFFHNDPTIYSLNVECLWLMYNLDQFTHKQNKSPKDFYVSLWVTWSRLYINKLRKKCA